MASEIAASLLAIGEVVFLICVMAVMILATVGCAGVLWIAFRDAKKWQDW